MKTAMGNQIKKQWKYVEFEFHSKYNKTETVRQNVISFCKLKRNNTNYEFKKHDFPHH